MKAIDALAALVLANKLACVLLLTAYVSTAPEKAPRSWGEIYTWGVDGAKQFSNLIRPTRPAETPAQPKP